MSWDEVATAGVIIIGNEILSGRTQDANLSFIAKKLNQRGILVKEARVIPDSEDVIADTVYHFHKTYSYVFTTGGIGPTHDDITAASVAKAFGREVEFNSQAVEILKQRYSQEDLTPGRKNMARMPKGAKLVANPVTQAPGFQIENVYVLAGIPEVMYGMLDSILPHLNSGQSIYSRAVRCSKPEGEVAEGLGVIQQQYQDIDIGSYPYWKADQFGVIVVLRGTNEARLTDAQKKVADLIIELGDTPILQDGENL